MVSEHELLAVSPIDGRYSGRTRELSEIVSEYGLIKYRVAVEAEWLKTLASGILPDVEKFSPELESVVVNLATNFAVGDAVRVKEIESITNHDVKAVEIWMREKLSDAGGFEDYLELIHFGCTSEDINNLAYAMMLREVRDDIIIPNFDKIGLDLQKKANDYADIALLAKTHGQPATPTTLGKEIAVFGDRLSKSVECLGEIAIFGKFSGATGTYSADHAAYPEVDWQKVCTDFVRRLGFAPSGPTTQIEPHDYQARFLSELALANSQMIDLARDIWQYISDRVFVQTVKKDEVGSSAMPQKVNPIDFENAEANFGLANAPAVYLAGKLPISRLQRDLTDSSAQRALGEVFGHTLIAQKSLIKGLGKISPNEQRIATDLENEWSVLTEAIQTVMRKNRIRNAYDTVKDASRGKEFTKDTYIEIINGLNIPDDDKKRLLELTPATYTGKAAEIAKSFKYRS
jgi:adenylosuccinate lyase